MLHFISATRGFIGVLTFMREAIAREEVKKR